MRFAIMMVNFDELNDFTHRDSVTLGRDHDEQMRPGQNAFQKWGFDPISPFLSLGSFGEAILTRFLREIFWVMIYNYISLITHYY